MNGRAVTPAHRLAATMLVALAMSALVFYLSLGADWLGLRLVFDEDAGGAIVTGVGGPAEGVVPEGAVIARVAAADGSDSLTLTARDFTGQLDGLPTFTEYEELLDRQDRLAEIRNGGPVVLEAADGAAWTVTAAPWRALGSLPSGFWIQFWVGMIAWVISGCIWAFRPDMTAARYVLLSGAATIVFSPIAGVYTTRELGMSDPLLRILNDLNFLGGSLYAAAFLALLIYYPRKLAPRWVGWTVVAVYVVWWVAQEFQVIESMVFARRALVMVAFPATIGLAVVQWRGTRADPVARGALQWFLLSWMVGVLTFGLIVLAPQLFGIDTSRYEAYGFLLFILVYVGLAFGIMRFRLFELGEWWVRMVIWTVTLIALVVLDLAFVFLLQLSGAVSLSLALLGCGLLWLPLRSWMWSRFLRGPERGDPALFEDVVSVGFGVGHEEQLERWSAVLRHVFDPLEIAPTDRTLSSAAIDDGGLALIVPPVARLPAMRLEYAYRGRRLFGRTDQARADEVAGMLGHVAASRQAYEQGVAQERQRIASDIHDNVGARLLSALHVGGDAPKNERIRETLTDLRRIINDVASQAATLDEALADLRVETADRLEAAGVALDWPAGQTPPVKLSAAATHALQSIVREAVSNALKHAHPSLIRVTADYRDGAACVEVEDDGPGFDPDRALSGAGLQTMRARAEARGGAVRWVPGRSGGACVAVSLPVEDAGRAH